MKIAVKIKQPERKLIAVVNADNNGLWIGNVYIDNEGNIQRTVYNSLEDACNRDCDRIPVYEGDSITITF